MVIGNTTDMFNKNGAISKDDVSIQNISTQKDIQNPVSLNEPNTTTFEDFKKSSVVEGIESLTPDIIDIKLLRGGKV